MVKCSKSDVRRLKTALHWKGNPELRQRIQMVLLRESGMTQPAIAAAMGVSLSTVNRAHMAYDHGGVKAQTQAERRTQAREPDAGRRESLARAFCQSRRRRRDVEHPRSQGGLRGSDRAWDER